MAKVRYEVCVAKESNGKTYWNKIGVVFQTDKGFSLKLESVPVEWNGWASLFEPKPKDAPATRRPAEENDSDAPF